MSHPAHIASEYAIPRAIHLPNQFLNLMGQFRTGKRTGPNIGYAPAAGSGEKASSLEAPAI